MTRRRGRPVLSLTPTVVLNRRKFAGNTQLNYSLPASPRNFCWGYSFKGRNYGGSRCLLSIFPPILSFLLILTSAFQHLALDLR